MRKFSVEKSTLMINTKNITQKNKKHDENFKNQNIMLKKKDIKLESIEIYNKKN